VSARGLTECFVVVFRVTHPTIVTRPPVAWAPLRRGGVSPWSGSSNSPASQSRASNSGQSLLAGTEVLVCTCGGIPRPPDEARRTRPDKTTWLESAVGVRRVVLLTLGHEELPKSVSVHGADPSLRLREPTPGVLLECDHGWVLLDTGFNTALIRDVALRSRFHPSVSYVPVLATEGEPLLEELDRAGVQAGEIQMVCLSHLHADHAGGLKHFAGKVPIQVQGRELEFGLSDRAEVEGIFRIDFDDPRIDWVKSNGEAEIAPGVVAIPTPGHTPGHQSFAVELDESVGGGGFVFAFDAADLSENISLESAIGSFVDVDPEDTVEQIRKLKRLAASRGFRLIPGHDPHEWPRLTDELQNQFGSQASG
jgi:N-acyl homoserine lactone hydrolase